MKKSLAILAAVFVSMPVMAELTNAEMIAASGGRLMVLGYACGAGDARTKEVIGMTLTMMKKRSKSKKDYDRAFDIYFYAQEQATLEFKAKKVNCSEALTAFDSIERDLSAASKR